MKKNPSYNEFVSNVVAYLVITSLEARFGNSSIEKYQSYTFSEEDKKVNQEFENKYLSILERYQMYSSVYTIPIIYLLDFVRSGYIENPTQLIQGCRLLQSRNLSDWERYAYESIFTQVSPQEIAGKIVALPNGAKMEFASFLVERYYLNGSGVIGNVWDEMKADKTNLAKISSILKTKAKRLKLLDKEKTLYIASKIDEAVSKM